MVFRIGGLIVNLLDVRAAEPLIAPARVAPPESGHRAQITMGVEDVDALAGDLVTRGATLLKGPMDRPWAMRTAAFQDPGGHVYEIAHALPRP